MPKIYPNAGKDHHSAADDHIGSSSSSLSSSSTDGRKEEEEKVFTVWKKSLLFNEKGFTVFDSKGNLAFRVDNYGDYGLWRRSASHVLLMDAVGLPLLTIRKKKLITLEEQWLIYQGEENTNPKYQVIKHQNIYKKTKTIARITHFSDHKVDGGGGGGRRKWVCCQIEGSYNHRTCTFQDERRQQQVAEIKRKDDFGNDVFRLVIRPEFDPAAAMAFVMVLEEMFGSKRRR